MFERSVGAYTAYGIEIYDSEKDETVFMIHDVFFEKDKAEKSLRLLNNTNPELIHFPSIVEDIIQDPDYFFDEIDNREK